MTIITAAVTLAPGADAGFRSRSARSMITSAVAHALLITWLALLHFTSPAAEGLVEVGWFEGGEAGEPAVPFGDPLSEGMPEPAAAPEILSTEPAPEVTTAPGRVEERFERDAPTGPIAPSPASNEASQDRINERLASMQETTRRPGLQVAVPGASTGSSRLAGVPGGTGKIGNGSPVSLSRGAGPAGSGSGGGSPVPLRRASRGPGSGGTGAALAVAPAPRVERRPAMADAEESTTVRQLSGASLMGPVADRPLVYHIVPQYPEWAKREAVEGSVSLYFIVLPDGRVKDNILVQRTSGFEDFDRNAIDALATWRFAPLNGATGEQWGAITFNYRLRDDYGR